MQDQVTPRIRALIVDDSALARHMVSQALAAQPDMEVVALAATGVVALEKVERHAPDVVVLDLEMPGMDGIETLRRIKKTNPGLPVLIFSSQTKRGAGATLDALLAGADDYALKPDGFADSGSSWAACQLELATKLRALSVRARRSQVHVAGASGRFERPPSATSGRFEVPANARSEPVTAITIGTSIGGPEALAVVLPRLRADLSVPLFVVQHMPEHFTGALAKRLSERSKLRIVEAQHGQLAEPGCVFLAPGDSHMQLSRRHEKVAILLDKGPLENGCRPSVDPLFRSAAKVYGNGLLAIVLTGMGSDGLHGAEQVKEAGGCVWVQDSESSAVWGMAGAIARAGLARRTVPLQSMAAVIEAALQHGVGGVWPVARKGE